MFVNKRSENLFIHIFKLLFLKLFRLLEYLLAYSKILVFNYFFKQVGAKTIELPKKSSACFLLKK